MNDKIIPWRELLDELRTQFRSTINDPEVKEVLSEMAKRIAEPVYSLKK